MKAPTYLFGEARERSSIHGVRLRASQDQKYKKIKVMKVKEFKSKVESLQKEGERFKIEYSGEEFNFGCFHVYEDGEKSFSVGKSISSMNVEKVTDKYVTLYSYDMFSQKTTYKMAINLIELI